MDTTTECGGYTWRQAWKLLCPVMVNMLLTLAIWIGVYGGKNDGTAFGSFLLDSGSEYTTGSDLYDGMLNGVGSVIIIGIVSFLILALAMFNMKRIVELWISGSCLAVLFGVSGMFFYDVFRLLDLPYLYAEVGAVVDAICYGTMGYEVFFKRSAPHFFHQCYVIANCSLVSVFYLRMFPVHTAWFVLLFIIGWDWFAVLTPYGPLHLVQEKAADYSQDILKFLMFSADSDTSYVEKQDPDVSQNGQGKIMEQIRASIEASKDEKTNLVAEDEKEKWSEEVTGLSDEVTVHEADEDIDCDTDSVKTAIGGQFQEDLIEDSPTAFDAFNDDRVRLGMGDFVFYGVLVGKAACSGSILATMAAYVGVCVGLLLTLMVVFKRDDTVPALPNSIALGMLFHFVVLYGVNM